MRAKLRLGERVERGGSGSEGGSTGGKSHPACGHRAVPGAGGPVAPGMMEGGAGGWASSREPIPSGMLLWHPGCQLGDRCWGSVLSSGTALPLFFGVGGALHSEKEKTHQNLGWVGFKKLNKKETWEANFYHTGGKKIYWPFWHFSRKREKAGIIICGLLTRHNSLQILWPVHK